MVFHQTEAVPENVDEILDPFRFPLSQAKTLQKKLQGPRPVRPPFSDGSGTIESHGPLLNQLEMSPVI